jgi:hypothetical protein
MPVKLSASRADVALIPRNSIIFFLLLILISVKAELSQYVRNVV